MLSRRRFLESVFVAAIAASVGAAEGKRAPRIVLRSSWQTVNIGDIAHTMRGHARPAREVFP